MLSGIEIKEQIINGVNGFIVDSNESDELFMKIKELDICLSTMHALRN